MSKTMPLARVQMAISQRKFWLLVDKGPRLGGCWLWLGPRDSSGRWFCGSSRPHRIAWRKLRPREPVPAGWFLLGTCGTTDCLRPEHRKPTERGEACRRFGALSKGTDVDKHGEWSACAKLRNDDVTFIWSNCWAYGAMALLARLFGVTPGTIDAIKHRRTWTHLTGKRPPTTETMSLRALRGLVAQRQAERAITIDTLAESRSAA